MTNPAFLIEGLMEQKFIENICGGIVPAVLIGANGKDVSLEAIADRIDSRLRIWRGKHYPIIIVFDREGRVETSEEIRVRLHDLLVGRGHEVEFCIGVADRTIENWILADKGTLGERSAIIAPENDYEGKNGKAKLKKLFAKNKSYNEPTDGVKMLKESCPSVIRENSASFKVLLDQLDIDCWWLDK